MALLDFPLTDPRSPVLCENDIYLRYPRAEDHQAWAALRTKSRHHLQPFEPSWAEAELDRASFRKRLRLYARDIRRGSARPYFIFRAEDDALVGGCTLSNIRYRAVMSGTVGYWVGEEYLRMGYGFSAVCALAAQAFDVLRLARLEAACLPRNTASRSLLEKAGFREEGRARSYLQICGKREDHVLYGLLPADHAAAIKNLSRPA